MLRGLDAEQNTKAKALMKELMDEAYANENATPFIHLPSKRHFKDYFQTIADPMALSIIKEKMKKYELLGDMKADLRLINSNCQQYNEPKSQIVRMSKDLINSIMETWIDSGLEKLMKQQDRAMKREMREQKKQVLQQKEMEEEKEALDMLDQNVDGFRTIRPKRRYYKLEEYKEYKNYMASADKTEEEASQAFGDLVERVFSFSSSLNVERYEKFLRFLLESGYGSNLDRENRTIEINAQNLFVEDLDKINEYIRELKNEK